MLVQRTQIVGVMMVVVVKWMRMGVVWMMMLMRVIRPVLVAW